MTEITKEYRIKATESNLKHKIIENVIKDFINGELAEYAEIDEFYVQSFKKEKTGRLYGLGVK